MHDLIIIGSGAAGVSAALFAMAKQLDAVTIYEDVGGKAGTQQQLLGQVGDEYLAGAEAVQQFERALALCPARSPRRARIGQHLADLYRALYDRTGDDGYAEAAQTILRDLLEGAG